MSFIQIAQYRKKANSPLAILRQIWRLQTDQSLKGITIVSAFTDPQIIGVLLDELDTKKPLKKLVRILLDFGQSRYNSDQDITEKLNLLAKKLKKDFHKNSGLFLINLGRFLHSKIIILHSMSNDNVSIGSLNFTSRAFLSNEEIMINIKSKNEILAVNNYIDTLIESSQKLKIPFKKLKKEFSSYREWLLYGVIFYEDKETSPFNFKLGLPSDLLKQPAVIIPDAQAEEPDNISLMQLLGIPRNNKVTSAWKKYCICTCYGYWCPRQLTDQADKKITKAVEAKTKSKIDPILKNENILIKKFHKRFNEIEDNIRNFNEKHKTKYQWDKQKAIKRVGKWIPNVVKKLNNKNNLYRLLAGVNKVSVPDFWAGDEIALREFEQSFCSHIILELSKKSVKNQVALWLRDYLDFPDSICLGSNWEECWDDNEAWLKWLQNQSTDPFKELPSTWELK